MTARDLIRQDDWQSGETRNWLQALLRGFRQRCPRCGDGRLFASYLKTERDCPNCGLELHHHQADDAPPYVTIFVVGHIIVAGVLVFEQLFAPPAWIQLALWLPLASALSLLLLPRVKGAFVGLQWALRMHGFGDAGPLRETSA